MQTLRWKDNRVGACFWSRVFRLSCPKNVEKKVFFPQVILYSIFEKICNYFLIKIFNWIVQNEKLRFWIQNEPPRKMMDRWHFRGQFWELCDFSKKYLLCPIYLRLDKNILVVTRVWLTSYSRFLCRKLSFYLLPRFWAIGVQSIISLKNTKSSLFCPRSFPIDQDQNIDQQNSAGVIWKEIETYSPNCKQMEHIFPTNKNA